MKAFSLLMIALALLATILLGAFAWLWYNNQKPIDPLPIATYGTKVTAENETQQKNKVQTTIVIQADSALRPALDEVSSRFSQRYPDLKPSIHYTDSRQVFAINPQSQPPVDLIISHQNISLSQIAALQALIDRSNAPNQKAQTLSPFGFAIVSGQAIEGAVLTNNPIATQFRNFLISSSGQDILAQHGFKGIDNYKNQVDDLFNPKMDINSKSNTALDVESILEDDK